YREKVYGANVGIDDAYVLSLFFDLFDPVNESESIIAPVFGMVHSDEEQAVFAMIESGQASATIQAYPNGAVTRYDWICSSFVYRQVYNQLTSQSTGSMAVRQKERNHFDISIHYALLSGEQADYVHMATYYRDRLLENGDLVVQDTSYQMKLDFFGGDQENWLIFKKMIAMTTTEQLEEMLNKLNQQGVHNILAVYNGWQKDGVYGGLPTTSYEVDKKIGGKEGMENLLETARKLGTDLYLYINPLLANPDTHYNITSDSVKKLNKRVYTETMYRQVYRDFHYLLPESTVELLEKNVNSFLDADMKNLSVDGISNTIFSYLHENQIYDRQHTINYYHAIFASLEEDFQLILPEPFAPYWKYTKAISNMPTESSKYVFTDEEVPFLPIVLNGVLPMYSDYSNFQANQTLYRLQLIEQGIYPSFLLTYEEPAELINTNSSDIYSSKFEYYEEKIVEYDREMKELALLRNGAMIADYEKDKGVSKVSYTNGLVIYVNFNEEEATIDGITIEGHSYKVGGQ
ncbi:MAG: hypothetical protein JW708_10705, partial [Vallitaleaceae bacterium]|nr:hypothetical protein [Vallitaleaceae bacterium]